MGAPPTDRAIKSAQADNFDNLNALVADTEFDRHLRFLNFGYRVLDGEQPCGPKLGFAFPNKDSAQLLFQTIGSTSLAGRRVVEIGCGRGGNLWLIRRNLEPGLVVGVDIAEGSIAYCNRSNPEPDAQFLVGDAEQTGLGSSIADVVLSVETGATYPDIERFFREAVRLLVPGGHLLYADIVQAELVDRYRELLEHLGMTCIEQRDISANVVAARDARAERQRLAFAKASTDDERAVAEFSGLTGSVLHHTFASGSHPYVVLRLRKDRDVAPPAERFLTAAEQALVRVNATVAVEALAISAPA